MEETAPRKRPADALDDLEADCPFRIELPSAPIVKKPVNKRRRTGSTESPAPTQKEKKDGSLQTGPFAPLGRFLKDPSTNMDRRYKVEPAEKWGPMGKFNSFILHGVKYYNQGFAYVANGSTIDKPRNTGEARQPRKKSEEDWVARILEIRAEDEHHVYARVYWMYWPDEIPARTSYKGKYVSGRQSFHGQNELIASNHMDIINVVSVTAPAIVNQWDENDEEEVQQALYWRQGYDIRTNELSSVEERCICKKPENPDKTLIRCSDEECGMWLHDDCLAHDALMRTWQRLGAREPHRSVAVKEEVNGDEPREPLSPSETGVAATAQDTIDVKAEEKTIRLSEDDGAASSVADIKDLTIVSSVPAAPEVKKRGRPRKSEARDLAETPYVGHFKAALTDESEKAPIMEITDLRHDVFGGERAWKEPVRCLRCKQDIQ